MAPSGSAWTWRANSRNSKSGTRSRRRRLCCCWRMPIAVPSLCLSRGVAASAFCLPRNRQIREVASAGPDGLTLQSHGRATYPKSRLVSYLRCAVRALASRAREQAILTALAAWWQRSLTVAARKLPSRAVRALASRAREQAILTALAAWWQRSLTVAARKLPSRAVRALASRAREHAILTALAAWWQRSLTVAARHLSYLPGGRCACEPRA